MSRRHVALAMGLLALLTGGTGIATAQGEQVVGQSADSSQQAGATANSTQQSPSNQNIDVRIFSPGDSGAVTQTNGSVALAGAGNANTATQSAAQSAGAGGVQAAGQSASNTQSAQADATSTQSHPTNSNISVRIDSPGDNGSVTQTNGSAAGAVAGNANHTSQSAEQAQAGGPCCHGTGSGTQAVGQAAGSDQTADATATSTQTKPSNTNISVRIDSPGDNGSVTQSNSSAALAAAGNLNDTTQQASQHAGGACCSGGGTQAIGQVAGNDQSASSNATSTQVAPSNLNVPVRIGSPGDDGDVTQSNVSGAASLAGNANVTAQKATQTQAGGACCKPAPLSIAAPCCGAGSGVQALEQAAWSTQSATSDATSDQFGASNVNAPVRIGSPGNGGSVDQSNTSAAGSAALNLNKLSQDATQTQAATGGPAVQAIGQKAANHQDADSSATSTQVKPTNTNTPVRIGSPGNDGNVTQANTSAALSAAANLNLTAQSAAQTQAGGCCRGVIYAAAAPVPGCGCGGSGVQAIGQFAANRQDAWSSADSTQYAPSNVNTPVAIGGRGSGGDLTQANTSLAASLAANANVLAQQATQRQVR